mmetsp:Transcript_40593/g.36014  ORF Transcript_40593/g.36014 Transcript_40593/m.36014 type:complete len:103 (-) Transcript_40593:154-462(-)
MSAIDDVLNDKEVISNFVQEMFDEFDKDKSGFIETSEMDTMMAKLREEISDEKVKLPESLQGTAAEVLKKFDTNKDGKLSKEEMAELVKQVLKMAYEACQNA